MRGFILKTIPYKLYRSVTIGLLNLRNAGFSLDNTQKKERPMSNNHHPTLAVSNPLQAASVIFYKPRAVFDALRERENWSWIPFLLLCIVLFIPPYLYFGLVNFDWWLNNAILPTLENLPPSQQQNALLQYSPFQMQLTTGLIPTLVLLLLYVIKAFYFSLMTRNDEKSIHGFSDWYGASFWMAMPMLLNALLSLVFIIFQESGAQISSALLSPLSLVFWLNTDMASPWFGLLTSLSIDGIWMVYLSYVCLRSWTNFSQTRALIVASIPLLFIIGLNALIAIMMS